MFNMLMTMMNVQVSVAVMVMTMIVFVATESSSSKCCAPFDRCKRRPACGVAKPRSAGPDLQVTLSALRIYICGTGLHQDDTSF